MKMCGWSKGTFTKYMNILVDAQVIVRQPRASTTEGRKTNLYQINHSCFYTGELMDRLRVSREKYKKVNSKILHGCTNGRIKAFKPHVSTRVDTNHNRPSQEKKFNVALEAKRIADDLDRGGANEGN
jgi:hypothetical protein